jgi:hypothetical protein
MRALIFFKETGEITKVIDEDSGQEIPWQSFTETEEE